jgi:hypothetical protein
MIRRKPSLISIATDESISFLMLTKDGCSQKLASMPLEAFLEGDAAADELPQAVMQSTNQILVVPDYWVGNDFQAFRARKQSVITAFIERKLKQDHPSLAEIGNFYNYAIVKDHANNPQLYTFYLQEMLAYQVYQRLKHLGLGPVRITTPAMIWQKKLEGLTDGFADQGVGLVHLVDGDCFLYFFFMGKFLFSRHIQLPATDGDASDTYNQLNYEINQSFYLYSQKTKGSVKALYMLAADPTAAGQLTDLLGREVLHLPDPMPDTEAQNDMASFPFCSGFCSLDLEAPGEQYIFYKPLKFELAWRPVQWAGIAVGLVLVALLVVESGYLHYRTGAVERQVHQLKMAGGEPPDMVLESVSLSLDEITRHLARPSGSGTIMRTLLAMPAGVAVNKLVLDVSATSRLNVEAVITADSPDAFKQILKTFLSQLNQRFSLKNHSLRERDVTIQLDRGNGNEKKPVYMIDFEMKIP